MKRVTPLSIRAKTVESARDMDAKTLGLVSRVEIGSVTTVSFHTECG